MEYLIYTSIALLNWFLDLRRETTQLTLRCWNSQLRIAVVACLGNIPRFFCLCLPPILSSLSSSFVPSPDPILLSIQSPETEEDTILEQVELRVLVYQGYVEHVQLSGLEHCFDLCIGFESLRICMISYVR